MDSVRESRIGADARRQMSADGQRVPGVGAQRPMRADARRNRERVLAAARAAFSEEGAGVQMEPIARRAGVGVGTLYRHFPTKRDLVVEIVTEISGERMANLDRALAVADPWEALATLVRSGAEAMARDAGLRRVYADIPEKNACSMADELRAKQDAVLARARDAGTVRADVSGDDFDALMAGLCASLANGVDARLAVDVLLAGLRAPSVP